MHYRCLPRPVVENEAMRLQTIRPEHIECIGRWSRAQMDVLRQDAPLARRGQLACFDDPVWPPTALVEPSDLLSVLEASGFVPEGVTHGHCLIRGKAVDSLLHGWLASERRTERS